MTSTRINRLEKRLLIILITGKTPQMVPLITLACGTEVVKARVNGEKVYVGVDALRKRYTEIHGKNEFRLLGYRERDKNFQLKEY